MVVHRPEQDWPHGQGMQESSSLCVKRSMPPPRSAASPARRSLPPIVTNAAAGPATWIPFAWRGRPSTTAPSMAWWSSCAGPTENRSRFLNSGNRSSSLRTMNCPGCMPYALYRAQSRIESPNVNTVNILLRVAAPSASRTIGAAPPKIARSHRRRPPSNFPAIVHPQWLLLRGGAVSR